MKILLQDLRFGLRLLARNPGATGVMLLTLALCIGLNTAMFSVTNSMIYFVLPFSDPDRLIRVHRTSAHSRSWPHGAGDFLDFREQNSVFGQMGAFYSENPNLTDGEAPPETLVGMRVSANFFSVLGVAPVLGRAFLPDEEQPAKYGVVVVSEALWRRRFGGQTNLLGRTVRLDGQPVTVVGVMPERMTHFRMWAVDVWKPIGFGPEKREERGARYLNVFGRLKPGVSLAQAQAEMRTLAARIIEAHPTSYNRGENVRLEKLRDSFSTSLDAARCHMVLAIAGFILLIGCVNVANLQLARATQRNREMAIRTALGAGRNRLLRQLLTESMLLALLGSGCGLLLAAWGNDWLAHYINDSVAGTGAKAIVQFPLDGRVLAYTLGVSVLTGLLVGLVPALQASRPEVNQALKEGGTTASAGRSARRFRGWLIISEVAITLVLLVGCALFGRSTGNLLRLERGYRTDHQLVMSLNVSKREHPEVAEREMLYRRVLDGLRTLPGVMNAGLTHTLPVWGPGSSRFIDIQGRPPSRPQTMLAHIGAATPGLFDTLGMSLKQGRDFTEQDAGSAPPVVIINETMARKYWPGESPVGQRISTGQAPPRDWAEIVGVVSDIGYPDASRTERTLPQLYSPFWQNVGFGTWLVLHTAVEPESLSDAVRRAVAAIDPGLPVDRLASLERTAGAEIIALRILFWMLGGFAALGLLLAAIGVYGVIAYTVAQRTNEVGIRMALGARRADVVWLLLRQGLAPMWVGLAIGLAGSLLLSRAMQSLLFGIAPWDPPTLITVILVLAGTGALACYLPARRAAQIEPMRALRHE